MEIGEDKKENQNNDLLYKIVVIGESDVGKTYLVSKYTKGILPKNPSSTIGVDFSTRTVPIQSADKVKAQIWDTAGKERFRAIITAHYHHSVGALLVYDITKEESFFACSRWMEEIRNQTEPDIDIMLVGNKLDLVENNGENRRVLKEVAGNFAKDNNLMFLETSTFTGENVKEAFEGLLQIIHQKKSGSQVRESEANSLPPDRQIDVLSNNAV
jgi:Rab family protein